MCAPGRARGYVPGGSCAGGPVPVRKARVGHPGDTVTVTPTGLLVNGTPVPNSRPPPSDKQGGRSLDKLSAGRWSAQAGSGSNRPTGGTVSIASTSRGGEGPAKCAPIFTRLWDLSARIDDQHSRADPRLIGARGGGENSHVRKFRRSVAVLESCAPGAPPGGGGAPPPRGDHLGAGGGGSGCSFSALGEDGATRSLFRDASPQGHHSPTKGSSQEKG